MSPSFLSSLPNDILWEILARVPKRSYPILSCVSKNFRYLVRSPELQKIRSLLRKDSLFICFKDQKRTQRWFTLRRDENNLRENRVAFIDIAFPYHYDANPYTIAIGPEIFFICGSFYPSSRMFIFDSRSGRLRQGPSSREDRLYKRVGLVGSKIYVIGKYRDNEMHVESFDLKTQTWELAPIPDSERPWMWTWTWTWSSLANVSLDRKVCLIDYGPIVYCYDTRDGSCESIDMPEYYWWRMGVCVINNVLYVYFAKIGLMWYDSELKQWRHVNDLSDLDKFVHVAMAEYYGKLMFLWEEYCGLDVGTKKIWCRMITLDRNEEGVHMTAETSQLLATAPLDITFYHFLSVSE